MFGISGTELFIIVVLVLVIFGPEKLPELARTAGKAIRMFKTAQEDMERVIRAEVYSPNADNDAAAAATATTAVSQEMEKATAAAQIWAATEEDEEEDEE